MKTSNGCADMPAMHENEDGKPLPASLTGVARNHVASFDYFVQHGLSEIVKRLRKVTLQIPGTKDPSSRVHVWFDEISLGKPSREGDGTSCSRDPRLFPRECRESSATYKAPMSATLAWSFGEPDNVYRRKFRLCSFPVMIGSVACHLWGASGGDLIRRGEERHEAGGYFILNGIERIIRLLIQQRQHYIMGMKRVAYSARGPLYTQYATAIRCVASDEHCSTVRVHYTSDGSARVAFVHRRQEYFLPAGLLLRALADVSDAEIQAIVASGVAGSGGKQFASKRVAIILEEIADLGIRNRSHALSYLGEHFRVQLGANPWETNVEIGKLLIEEHVFIHLENGKDKFNLLLFMMQKLYALVTGQCSPDNPDSPMHHEVLLPGVLMQTLFREKLQDALTRVKESLLQESGESFSTDDGEWLSQIAMSAITKMNIGRLMEYFLATGNLVSRTGLGLSQTSGFTVVADKLNYMVCAKDLLTLFFLRPHNHIHHILFINKFVIITIITFASTPNIAIPFALSICASRSLFCRAANNYSAKAVARIMGIFVPCAYTRW
mmetsp:Transcript_14619/g.59653  ORF Transcript_14619/g.59653 Transcript_14619/m.59653 type:complete len:552 (+) Transcript_14619:299-1954(+)